MDSQGASAARATPRPGTSPGKDGLVLRRFWRVETIPQRYWECLIFAMFRYGAMYGGRTSPGGELTDESYGDRG